MSDRRTCVGCQRETYFPKEGGDLCYHCAGIRRLTDRQVAYLAAVQRLYDAAPGLNYPHCDQYVLHAPNECRYCGERQDLVELRLTHHIAFTGESLGGWLDPCPSEAFRPAEVRDRWGGNRAYPEGTEPQGWYTA